MKNKAKEKILVLGITGSFGSGKTTATKMFKKLGAFCIDADKIYHRLIKPKSLLYRKIVSVFGNDILLFKQGQINRKRLAKFVFSKKEYLKKLSRITHPVVIKEIKLKLAKFKKTSRSRVIIIDAPLLIEAGLVKMIDKLIVVKINKKNQITRCKKNFKMSKNEIIKRIRTQVPLSEKIKLADYIIDNNGTLRGARRQVEDIWREIVELKRR